MFYLLFELFYRPEGILRFLRIFKYITFRTGAAIVTAFLISFIFGPYFIAQLKKLNMGQVIREDGPESHKTKSGTPTMGGIFIIISILTSLIFWADLSNLFVLISFVIIFLVGLLGLTDDLLKIRRKSSKGVIAKIKFTCQVLIAVLIFIFLYHVNHRYPSTVLYFPIFKFVHIEMGLFYVFIVIITFAGASNAVNLTDGLDGLAIGSTTIAFGALGIICYLTGNYIFADYLNLPFIALAGELTIVCLSCFGAGLGFLWYNSYPAEVFMGDVGSLTLGALFGGIAVMIKQEILIILIGGIFVMEALSVIMQVSSYKMTKKRIFRMTPIHHHFELQGIPEPKIVMRFWIIAFIFSIIAIATLKLR